MKQHETHTYCRLDQTARSILLGHTVYNNDNNDAESTDDAQQAGIWQMAHRKEQHGRQEKEGQHSDLFERESGEQRVDTITQQNDQCYTTCDQLCNKQSCDPNSPLQTKR